jgi:hypothetical protein
MHLVKMKFLSALIILLTYTGFTYANSNPDSLLTELSIAINNKESYVRQKNQRIEELKQLLKQDDITPNQQFNLYNKLYFEYRSFQYDSAFTYASKLQQAARHLNDPVKTTYSKLKLSFTLLSSGMFKETLDSLNTVNIARMPDSIKADYYSLKGRTYYDLANYTMDEYYASRYVQQGNNYTDSAIAVGEPNSYFFYSHRGLRNLKVKNYPAAETDFRYILDNYTLTDNQYAIATSSLANVYRAQGENEKAILLMAQAAIADIRSSTREAVALMNLSEMLYRQGDEVRAYFYIKQALEDATMYGARQRKIQVAAILPIIEGERLATVESQRSRLFVYSIMVTLLSVLVILFAFIIFRQLKQLREARRIESEASDKLQETNKKLVEANRIKEEYIGYSFNMYTDYIDKLEKFKQSVDKKLVAKKYDEINYVMKSINLKKEREALYISFDKIFIRLFPNFVSEFNSYFKDEDKIILKDHETLNIELRIFALIRIGIHDHEQIAKILEYSVNTIYTYKTRVKNRSILPNEEFEKRIMEIKAF